MILGGCGVSGEPSVIKIIRDMGVTKHQNLDPKSASSKSFRLQPEELTPEEQGYISHFCLT